jgi:hypothetical protein
MIFAWCREVQTMNNDISVIAIRLFSAEEVLA